jgi:hypothetical protein
VQPVERRQQYHPVEVVLDEELLLGVKPFFKRTKNYQSLLDRKVFRRLFK